MECVDLDSSVPDWLIEHPGLLPLFQELEIEYCCGGKSLGTACREQGLSPEVVLTQCYLWINDPKRNLYAAEVTSWRGLQ